MTPAVAWREAKVTKVYFALQLVNSDYHNSSRLKTCWSWKSSRSLFAKWSFEAEIVPFVVFLPWIENGDPYFLLVFLLIVAARKIRFKRKKKWIVEVVSFRWMTLNSAFGDRGVWDDVKTVHYSYIFGRTDNLMPTLLKNYGPGKIDSELSCLMIWIVDSCLGFEHFAPN